MFISNLPAVSLSSAQATDGNINTDQQNHTTTSSLISSSSSATSSSAQSPAIIPGNNHQFIICPSNNQSDRGEEYQQQHSWPAGASKMARVANKIVNSINSVSTPKQLHKQTALQQQQLNFTQQGQSSSVPHNSSQSSLQQNQTQLFGSFYLFCQLSS